MIGENKVIGQNNLIQTFQNMVNDTTVVFPQFIILVGMKGSGKKTLAKLIHQMISRHCFINKIVLEDVKVETIRDMITDAQKVIDRTLYVIPDADKMSAAAKNTLLKITEEPPKDVWFILTLENESNTLATIKSRGQMYRMETYTPEEIVSYAKNLDTSEIEIVADICETPGEVDLLRKNGVLALYNYVELVVDNIAECNGSNAFKIADKIAFKDTDEDKFDLRLFWKTFMKVCSDRLRTENDIKYADGIKVTSEYLQQLNINGLNKQATFDGWILSIREKWL